MIFDHHKKSIFMLGGQAWPWSWWQGVCQTPYHPTRHCPQAPRASIFAIFKFTSALSVYFQAWGSSLAMVMVLRSLANSLGSTRPAAAPKHQGHLFCHCQIHFCPRSVFSRLGSSLAMVMVTRSLQNSLPPDTPLTPSTKGIFFCR